MKTVAAMVVLLYLLPALLLADTQNDYLQGQADGKLAADGSVVWGLAGLGCGIFGVGFAYLHKPNPPTFPLIGKSAAYTLAYVEAYGDSSRNKNTMYALAGWFAWLLFWVAVYTE